jgi:hypothetical protein
MVVPTLSGWNKFRRIVSRTFQKIQIFYHGTWKHRYQRCPWCQKVFDKYPRERDLDFTKNFIFNQHCFDCRLKAVNNPTNIEMIEVNQSLIPTVRVPHKETVTVRM